MSLWEFGNECLCWLIRILFCEYCQSWSMRASFPAWAVQLAAPSPHGHLLGSDPQPRSPDDGRKNALSNRPKL